MLAFVLLIKQYVLTTKQGLLVENYFTELAIVTKNFEKALKTIPLPLFTVIIF